MRATRAVTELFLGLQKGWDRAAPAQIRDQNLQRIFNAGLSGTKNGLGGIVVSSAENMTYVGGPRGIRTPDQRIMSPLLFR